MEEKLAEYRARKAKEHVELKSSKNWSNKVVDYFIRNRQGQQMTGKKEDSNPKREDENVQPAENPRTLSQKSDEDDNRELQFPLTREEKMYKTASIGLKITLWLILWALFIEIGFGAVYFVVSMLFIIYRTMRSGSRDKNKLSAYSVFNPNCERLDGTFTAEQFEKELRYGAGSV